MRGPWEWLDPGAVSWEDFNRAKPALCDFVCRFPSLAGRLPSILLVTNGYVGRTPATFQSDGDLAGQAISRHFNMPAFVLGVPESRTELTTALTIANEPFTRAVLLFRLPLQWSLAAAPGENYPGFEILLSWLTHRQFLGPVLLLDDVQLIRHVPELCRAGRCDAAFWLRGTPPADLEGRVLRA